MSDKNNSVDSDKIKQLLMQLRAKFDMENPVPAPQAPMQDEEEAYHAEETTISFAIHHEDEITEEPEDEAIMPLHELSKAFGEFHDQMKKGSAVGKDEEKPHIAPEEQESSCGDETVAFLLDRYAISPTPKKDREQAAEKKPPVSQIPATDKAEPLQKETAFDFPNVDETFTEPVSQEDKKLLDELEIAQEEQPVLPSSEEEDERLFSEEAAEETASDEIQEAEEIEEAQEVEENAEEPSFSVQEEVGQAYNEEDNTPVPPSIETEFSEEDYVQETLDITSVLPVAKKEEERNEVYDTASFIPLSSVGDDVADKADEAKVDEAEEEKPSPVLPQAPADSLAEREDSAQKVPDDSDSGDGGDSRPLTVTFPIGETREDKADISEQAAPGEESPADSKDATDYGIKIETSLFSAISSSKSAKTSDASSSEPKKDKKEEKHQEEEPPLPTPAQKPQEAPQVSKREPQKEEKTEKEEKTPSREKKDIYFSSADKKLSWEGEVAQRKKKKPAFYATEYTSRTQTEHMRKKLSAEINRAKTRLVLAIVFAFAILYAENALLLGGIIPAFLQGGGKDIACTVLLAAVIGLCSKEIYRGFSALCYKRMLPAGMVGIMAICSLLYTTALAIYGGTSGIEPLSPRVAFAASLACVLLLYWETVRYENRFSSFCVLAQAGDKLVFSLASPKDALRESNVLGKNLSEDITYIYRVRKTGFVDEFVSRTGRVCEDEKQNFWLLVLSFAISFACGVTAFAMGRAPLDALGFMMTAWSVALPVSMCATHIYPMARALYTAGEDSTILGEKSVHECAKLDAVEFEDIEAIPSRKVDVKNVKMYVGDVARVFYCVASLFHLVGGPLWGFFNKSTKELGYTENVVLKESVSGGLCAMVDNNFHLLVGDGEYMQNNGVKLFYDAEDERWIEKGVFIMFAAINHKICAKFYIQYTMSPAFEYNVKRLHRAGMATIIRTYDPNITNRLLLRIAALGDYRVHIVTKTPEQYKDFAAAHLTGGIVTTADSNKLLQLFFLCMRTRGVIAATRLLKTLSMLFGAALGFGFLFVGASTIPSAVLGLYHLIWLFITVMWTRWCIRRPKTPKKKQKETEK